ncbi:MAG TPA: nitronate monooxygenase family protein [Steroidobacteraceae bacterium]|jgi:nitronate monooxygenase
MALPALLQHSLRLPVVAAPMFLVSGPDLVVGCCSQGVVGTFPALNQRTTAGLDAWLTAIRQRCSDIESRTQTKVAPFGVNLIVHRTNPRLQDDLDCCVRHRVPLVVTSLGAARAVTDAVHSYGGIVFHDVTTTHHARKALDAGVDGLICVAGGAGGHAGTGSPFALIGEIRRFFSGTVLLAGALSTGRDIAAAQAMGADLGYLGTRFIATQESLAPESYKALIAASSAADIVYTAVVSGIPANFLRPSLVAGGIDLRNAQPPAHMDLGTESALASEPDHEVGSKAKPWRDLWSAGQGVGAIDNAPSVAFLVSQLEREYQEAVTAFSAASACYVGKSSK